MLKEIVEEQKESVKKEKKIMIVSSSLTGILYLIAIIAYILIGYLANVWHPTWVVFLAPIIISSLVVAIWEKDANKFCYPVFVVAVYILFSSLFGLWHPLWVVFITIPLYYSLLNSKNKLKD